MFFNKARKPRTNEAIQTARSSTFRRAVAVFFLWLLVVPTYASATEVAVSFRDIVECPHFVVQFEC